MASLVLSECGLRPLPKILLYRGTSAPLRKPLGCEVRLPKMDLSLRRREASILGSGVSARDRHWGLRVSAPLKLASVSEGGEAEGQKSSSFDPGSPPPFSLGEIRAAIPKHCWVKNPWRSMSYVLRDIVVVFGLAAAAAYFNHWLVWSVYWVAQGTMFWALFVLGHDCGHGSFSNNRTLNNVVGHLLHSFILVPYHGWRISHRTHHQNHGHVENDESWHPIPENIYRKLDDTTKNLRFTAPFPMLAYPFYLWSRSPGKTGSHFHPDSDLFLPNEKKDVIVSTACWSTMVALLVGLSCWMGPIPVLKLYGVPYWIFVMWLDFVTYLHHHGHEQKLPWYRGKIPHYHLVEATEAVKPVLGKYYRQPQKSGPIPVHLVADLLTSLRHDHFVSDQGDVVYYQTDPHFASSKGKSE